MTDSRYNSKNKNKNVQHIMLWDTWYYLHGITKIC